MRGLLRAGVALCLALAGGCAQRSPSATSPPIVLWHAYRGAELAGLKASVARFEAAAPGRRVRLVDIPYDAFPNKLNVAVPRGNGPDLFIFNHDRLGGWAEAGLVEPIGFWTDEALADRFFPNTLDPLVYRGELYGLPLAFKTLALYYDTGLVAAPPASTDELAGIARALRAKDPSVWGVAWELDSLYFHAPWLHGFGGAVYADDRDTLAINSAAAAASVDFVRRWLTEDRIIPEEATSALITALFNDHKLAFVVSGPWFRGELGENTRWAVAPLPVVSETGRPARPFLGVEGVLLSAHGHQKRRAFELMRFLTSDAEASARLRAGAQLVANQAPYEDPAVAADPFASAFRAQVKQTVALSNRPDMRRIWTPMKTALSQAIVHGVPASEALGEAARGLKEARR